MSTQEAAVLQVMRDKGLSAHQEMRKIMQSDKIDQAAVKRKAITLMEATNLLMMPGRRVVAAGAKQGLE